MMAENLVDGLNIYSKSSIERLCKDCIYGKHTTHPYYDSKSREKEILEYVHINIWGPYVREPLTRDSRARTSLPERPCS